jgi:arginyl-tRNA synthetase
MDPPLEPLAGLMIKAFPNSYPSLNPTDIYRSHIAELLAPLTEKDAEFIYPKLLWTQTLDKGDLMLPIPSLQIKIKGKSPNDLAKEWAEKVISIFVYRKAHIN